MTKPTENDIARFQAQLALALLKRRLNADEHLNAQQLAQLITHSAPPDSAMQWKQHLDDCTECYAVFLDVAQEQLASSPVTEKTASPLTIKFSHWRYALGFALPVVLVSVLYFSWPQQQLMHEEKVVLTLDEKAIQFERIEPVQVPAEPRLSPIVQSEKSNPIVISPSMEKELAQKTPAAVSAVQTQTITPDPALAKQMSAESATLQNPLITDAANEARAKLNAKKQESEKALSNFSQQEKMRAMGETKSTSGVLNAAPNVAMASAPIRAPVPASTAPTEADRIEVTGARISAADNNCSDCDADEKFNVALAQWAKNTLEKCDSNKLDLLQTRNQWREMLNKHNTVKRDELLKIEEPSDKIGWCKFAAVIQVDLEK